LDNTTAIHKIAIVGDYLPRKCGIATFSHDLRGGLAGQYPNVEVFVAPVNDVAEGYTYEDEVRFEFAENDLDSYRRAAEYLNLSDADVVCLQHEYGIFGGPAGSFILALLKDLRIPVVTTLHTILAVPNADQRRVLEELCALSSRLIVMTERGLSMLHEIYGVSLDKIDLIAHGIPDLPFVDPNFSKDLFGVEGREVLLTFGLLAPNKGIEVALRALPEIVREFPDLVYIILGATHPKLVREQGETYRLGLERLARDMGIGRNVSFHDRFVELPQLAEFLGVADIYLTPYLNEAQITSGTLSYAFGSGKAVVSTPYWHARELLEDGRGVLVPFGDSASLAREVTALLKDEKRRHAMRKRAFLLGREMIWPKTAQRYMESFEKARRGTSASRRLSVRTLEEKRMELPRLRLDHLSRMSDSTGMFQHAIYTLPNFAHGYCTDDNARALIAAVMLEDRAVDFPEIARLSSTYASFVQHAFNPDQKRFHNLMSFDRRWLDAEGSEDSQGRALWALGTCVGRSRRRDLQVWAAQLFEQALAQTLETRSPRAWAFALLGIDEYLKRLSGDRMASQARDLLTERLTGLFHENASEEWPWFEETVSYANARLPQVLIMNGRKLGDRQAMRIGMESLKWLVSIQQSSSGQFRPVGSAGFFPRGGKLAQFDQQPIEAQGTISACIEAFRSTRDPSWHAHASAAFEWFLGRNDLNQPLYDAASGGCRDGLHVDRVNENQGAESTLAFLISLSEMELLNNDLGVFDEPILRPEKHNAPVTESLTDPLLVPVST
jgi:glycosyltransferase involved in cell wall biosynthesis